MDWNKNYNPRSDMKAMMRAIRNNMGYIKSDRFFEIHLKYWENAIIRYRSRCGRGSGGYK